MRNDKKLSKEKVKKKKRREKKRGKFSVSVFPFLFFYFYLPSCPPSPPRATRRQRASFPGTIITDLVPFFFVPLIMAILLLRRALRAPLPSPFGSKLVCSCARLCVSACFVPARARRTPVIIRCVENMGMNISRCVCSYVVWDRRSSISTHVHTDSSASVYVHACAYACHRLFSRDPFPTFSFFSSFFFLLYSFSFFSPFSVLILLTIYICMYKLQRAILCANVYPKMYFILICACRYAHGFSDAWSRNRLSRNRSPP